MVKRREEYYAKAALEYCFPQKFHDLRVADKPDLRDDCDSIGIEVVFAEFESTRKIESCWCKARETDDPKIKQKNIAEIEKLNGKYSEKILSCPVAYQVQLLNGILYAFQKKVNKLQQYEKMNSYELFIKAETILDEDEREYILSGFIGCNNQERKFEYVYLYLINEMYIFNLVTHSYKNIKCDSSIINQIAMTAISEGENH